MLDKKKHNIGESLETLDNNVMLPLIIEKLKKLSHTRNVKIYLKHRLKCSVKDMKCSNEIERNNAKLKNKELLTLLITYKFDNMIKNIGGHLMAHLQ